jgi:hypothetical protein
MNRVTVCICGKPVVLRSPHQRARCPDHREANRVVRSTNAWAKTSRAVRATGVCSHCGAYGVPIEADHVTGAADPASPVQPLCVPCHRDRTAGRW